MKKTLSIITVAIFLAFGFSACDDDLGLLGNITITSSNAIGDQPYAADQVFEFHSSVCNANFNNVSIHIDSLDVDTVINGSFGTVFVGLTESLLNVEDINNITFPLCGINLRDTVTGTYDFTYNVDWSFIEQIDTTSLNKMITTGLVQANALGNLFAVAASETAFYVAISGNINITEFGGNGSLVNGSINNMVCIYVTRDHLETLMQMPASQRAAIDLTTEFSTITFNGSMESRRASIETVLQALDDMNE